MSQANATAAAMRTLMVDKSTGLFTDTVASGSGTPDGTGDHSAWHSQVFAMWAGVAEAVSSATLLKFLKAKAPGVGVTGSVYAA
jgi:hypothetical protein